MYREYVSQLRNLVNDSIDKHDRASVVFGSIVMTKLSFDFYTWIFYHDLSVRQRCQEGLFRFIKSLPILKDKIREEVDKNKKEMTETMAIKAEFITSLDTGKAYDEIVRIMQDYVNYDQIDWGSGKMSGTTFTDDPEISRLCQFTYSKYMLYNPLHSDVFRSLRKMEAEIIHMTLSLYNAPTDGSGVLTSGGSESLGLAVLAARNRAHKKGIEWPEVVMCRTGHSGIDKACHYFRVKLIKVGYNADLSANVVAMRRAINANTCLLVGSAPDYPHGLIDDLEAISDLATKYDIPMHVDACMGGFLLPFAADAGYPLPPFDFKLPGVTSISADCHKYGYCPKGASVLMFRNQELRKNVIFTCVNWPGGVYATPTYAGSRAGGNIAVCWSVLNMIGRNGYIERTRRVIEDCLKLKKAVQSIDGLDLLGDPKLCICSFTSKQFNIYTLLTEMKNLGWTMGVLQYPPALHLDVTGLTTKTGVIEEFIADLKICTAKLIKSGDIAPEGAAAIYGMASSLPDRKIVAELAQHFVEINYKTTKE